MYEVVVEHVTAYLRHSTSGSWRGLLPSLLVYSHLLLLNLLRHQLYHVVNVTTGYKTTDGAHYVSLLFYSSRTHGIVY